jgi:glycerol-3-phosphate acyltransferase PlsX
VALKSMEGVAHLISNRLKAEFTASLYGKLAGLIARPVLRRAAASLDPRRYNGACMVGLDGIVVKSHGGADSLAFSRAISLAAQAARRGLTAHIAQALQTQRS